ncbi:hypothetical protein N1851_007806 [Merluccius polli]|uniref:Endonuclease/exonuclease/phosphatase domain-containing protein n=1 Tax=Merluccius polli TaxID=89951 RepID=A0AA47N384_MERPO|nr:hypothetical protein N1851_007806 [Merluccius polli]
MASSETPSLSIRHGVWIQPDPSVPVEEVLLAVGDQVGHANLSHASRMNKEVVVFVKEERLVADLLASGVTLNGLYLQVYLLLRWRRGRLPREELRNIRVTTPDDLFPTFLLPTLEILYILVKGVHSFAHTVKRRRRGRWAGALVRLRQRGLHTPLPGIFLSNVRSLPNKNRDFPSSAVLCFTETWLSGLIPDSALHLAGFQLCRADRDTELSGKTKGGGICFYINSGWCNDVTVIQQHCSPDLESFIMNLKRRRRGRWAGALVRLRQRGLHTPLPGIFLSNVRSLPNKNRDFPSSAVLCFTETWLSGLIPDSALHLAGFQLCRADRDTELSGKTNGGGICFYINSGWCNDVTVIQQHCSPDLESFIINCKPFYSPCEFASFILANVQDAQRMLADQILCVERSNPDYLVIVLGDFNKGNLTHDLPEYPFTSPLPGSPSLVFPRSFPTKHWSKSCSASGRWRVVLKRRAACPHRPAGGHTQTATVAGEEAAAAVVAAAAADAKRRSGPAPPTESGGGQASNRQTEEQAAETAAETAAVDSSAALEERPGATEETEEVQTAGEEVRGGHSGGGQAAESDQSQAAGVEVRRGESGVTRTMGDDEEGTEEQTAETVAVGSSAALEEGPEATGEVQRVGEEVRGGHSSRGQAAESEQCQAAGVEVRREESGVTRSVGEDEMEDEMECDSDLTCLCSRLTVFKWRHVHSRGHQHFPR